MRTILSSSCVVMWSHPICYARILHPRKLHIEKRLLKIPSKRLLCLGKRIDDETKCSIAFTCSPQISMWCYTPPDPPQSLFMHEYTSLPSSKQSWAGSIAHYNSCLVAVCNVLEPRRQPFIALNQWHITGWTVIRLRTTATRHEPRRHICTTGPTDKDYEEFGV